MNCNNIDIIYSKKSINKIKYIKGLNIKYHEANNDKDISLVLRKVKINSNLIILIPGKLKTYNNITNVLKTINTPVVYCSIDNVDIHDKKNNIIKNLKYVIHGFKYTTTEILLSLALKIINFKGEKNYN